MKYIRLFEARSIHSIEIQLKRYGIKNYTINLDGTIDVDGTVDLYDKNLTKIPFKFGKVTGNFFCSSNQLTRLEGSPYYVGGDFYCNNNKLNNLIGSPEEVDGDFLCRYNNLISLEGMPLEIGGNFYCINNPNLKELNSVSNIEGNIYCNKHVDISKFDGYCKKNYTKLMKHLKLFENFNQFAKAHYMFNSDLLKEELVKFNIENYTINSDGSIDVDDDVNLREMKLSKIPFKFGKVNGDFDCSRNRLKTLEGSPYYVGGSFYCYDNDLEDLEFSPSEVTGNFDCTFNSLESVYGMPLEIGGSFNCKHNLELEEIDSVSNIEGNLYCPNIDTSKFTGYCKKIIK